MKLIKGIFLLFIVSLFFSVSSTKAEVFVGMNGVEVPSLSRIYTSSAYDKTKSGPKQYLETVAMDATVKARTYATFASAGYSSWVTQEVKKEKNWGSENTSKNQYKLQLKTVKNHITSKKYYGIRKYDWAK